VSDRFFTAEPLDLGEFILDGPEAQHLAHVRRFGAGELVALFNGDGKEYVAEIAAVEKKQVTLNVVRIEQPRRELPFELHVGAALPKGDRGDFLIEKLTELGVTDFTPLLTSRSVVQPKPTRVEKLHRAVIEASKQCGRNRLMRVHPPARVEEWPRLASLPPRRWIAHFDGMPLPRPAEITDGVAVAVGPEGGFTQEELTAAGQCGFERVALGPCVLRVETAALALAAFIALSQRA
jgi:16S rRNA (uracil1498-N3)-methyltransferase